MVSFFESFGISELLLLVLLFGLPLWALFSVLLTPRARWRAARRSQIVWVLILLFVPIIGALFYLISVRPQLRATQ
jgi:hypothetical protein